MENNYSLGQIKTMQQGGRFLSLILKQLLKMAREKKSGDELEQVAQRMIKEVHGTPAFMEAINEKKENYPAAICLSINNEVVHGLPFGKKIRSSDVVSIDIGMRFKGLITDMAWTIYIEGKDPQIKKMLSVNEQALRLAAKQAYSGNKINNISYPIQKTAYDNNFYPVVELAGHGVGNHLHEEPSVFNISQYSNKDKILKQGMVIAIEPIFVLKPYKRLNFKDNWSIIVKDNIASHFEFSVAVLQQSKILTPSPI